MKELNKYESTINNIRTFADINSTNLSWTTYQEDDMELFKMGSWINKIHDLVCEISDIYQMGKEGSGFIFYDGTQPYLVIERDWGTAAILCNELSGTEGLIPLGSFKIRTTIEFEKI